MALAFRSDFDFWSPIRESAKDRKGWNMHCMQTWFLRGTSWRGHFKQETHINIIQLRMKKAMFEKFPRNSIKRSLTLWRGRYLWHLRRVLRFLKKKKKTWNRHAISSDKATYISPSLRDVVILRSQKPTQNQASSAIFWGVILITISTMYLIPNCSKCPEQKWQFLTSPCTKIQLKLSTQLPFKTHI